MAKFEANVTKVLSLLSKSVYTNPDIFVRELTSNAFDACEKLRYLAMTDQNLTNISNTQFKIEIDIDKILKTITFRDNGIGLTAEEMQTHLGTVASSGTEMFLKNLSQTVDQKTNDLIGQFGIGFYSAFVVAKKVEVKSRSVKYPDQAHIWQSDGIEEFTIEETTFNSQYNTEVKLYLKEEIEDEYLDKFKIENIIKTYLSHISIPIEILYEGETHIVDQTSEALWTKNKSEISEESYKKFYSEISHLPGEPEEIIHKDIEGKVNFKAILYIPSTKPFDLYNPDRTTKIKLYIKKVLISESLDVIPRYLRFLVGVINSEDLPLNISRESIQNDVKLRLIKDRITVDVLKLLEKISQDNSEKYYKIWSNFGSVLKEGLCEGFANRDLLLSLVRFKTTKCKELTSFKEYISRMKESQKSLYFIFGQKSQEADSNPYLEYFQQKDIEVILFEDDVDPFWLNLVSDVEGKDLKAANSSDINIEQLGDDKKQESDFENIFEKQVIERFSNILGNKISKVVISKRLVDSPVCLSKSNGSMDPVMEKILIEQRQKDKISPRTLEINPNAQVIQHLMGLSSDDKKEEIEKIVFTLFDLANINFGTEIENKSTFVKRVFEIMQKKL